MSSSVNMWNPSELYKRVTCVMMVRAGHTNAEIRKAAMCSLNTVKTIRVQLEECDEVVDSVIVRKQHSRRSDCVRTDAFLVGLQQRATADLGVGIRALARDVGVAPSTVKVALNEDLRYASYTRRRGQLITAKTREKRLANAKRLLSWLKHPAQPGTPTPTFGHPVPLTLILWITLCGAQLSGTSTGRPAIPKRSWWPGI